MDAIHSVIDLASASFTTPSFYLSQILHCVGSQNDPTSFVRPLHRLLCCVLLFYMNTADKDKGKLFFFSWRWHVQGGTALHQFLIVASDVCEWSDILCFNHFSIRQRTLGTIECEVGLVPEPVWMFCRCESLLNLQEICPGFLAHNLVTLTHIHINSVLLYFFGCWIGQHVGRNQRRFWQQLLNGKCHRLTVILECHHPMQIPLLLPIIHCAHYHDFEGGLEMLKVYTENYMKSNWSKTEMFKIK